MAWERIPEFVCQYAYRISPLKFADDELASDCLTLIGTAHRIIEMEFLAFLGAQLEQMAMSLGHRLGDRDARVSSLRNEGRILQGYAADQIQTAGKLQELYSVSSRGGDASAQHVGYVTKGFGPGKALERRLQEKRREPDERTHFDRISLLQAWDDLLRLGRSHGHLWLGEIVQQVRHQLRETYNGEAAGSDREILTHFADDAESAQQGGYDGEGRRVSEAEATASRMRDGEIAC